MEPGLYDQVDLQRRRGEADGCHFQSSGDYLFGSTTILKSDALPDSCFPVKVMKGDYNASIGGATFAEVRVGAYISDFTTKHKSTAPRIEDSANTVGRRGRQETTAAGRRSADR